MKKALVLILGLMMVGTMVFAQDAAAVKFTGTIQTGAVITLDSEEDPLIALYNADDPDITRNSLNVNAALGDFSIDMIIRTNDPGAPFGVANFWVTGLFLDKMVELRFGNIDHKAVDTKNKGWGGLNIYGAQVVVVPITGLSLGAAVPVVYGTALPGDALDFADAMANFKIGAKYSMPNLADFVLTYGGSDEALDTDGADFTAGVNVTAIPSLVAQLEAQMLNIGADTGVDLATGKITGNEIDIFENVEYTMAPFRFGLKAIETMYNSDTDLDMVIAVTPNATYTVMTGVDLGLDVTYTMNNVVIDIVALTSDQVTKLVVDPSVKFTFAKDMTLKIDAAYTIPDLDSSDVWNCPINFNFLFAF